jgi:hypothetical protein
MLRPPFKPFAHPLGVAPHSLRTTDLMEEDLDQRELYSKPRDWELRLGLKGL